MLGLHRLSVLRRVIGMLGRHRGDLAVGLPCVPLAALLALWIPKAIGSLIDGVIAGEASVGRGCALILAAGAAEVTLRYTARRHLINASRRIEERLKNELMGHIGRLPVTWFDRARTGDIISRLTQDVELLRFLVGPTLLHGGAALVIVPGGFWLMASLSPLVCLCALAAFALLLGSMAVVMPRMQRESKNVQEAIGAISQRASEAFAGIRVLMSFGRAPAETAAMGTMCQSYLEHNVRLTRTRALLNLFIHTSRELAVLSVLVVGVLEAVAGRLTLGELFQFLILAGVMMWPLMATSWILTVAHRALAAAERIEELFAVRPEADSGTAPDLHGRLSVRGLTFRYHGQSAPALRDVSFELAPGQKLGLAGPAGSGKSTLLALLMRLYDPPPGTVWVDGFDVLELRPSVLRRTFAVAPQEPFLFSDTILGNVAFGSPSPGDVDLAVHQSALEQDLDDFEEGLQSIIGERGMTLSGGQKQRVSLARALAAGRDTLVLDDTLSAVDHSTEDVILTRLREAGSGRTVLVASHRLSAVRDADLILVLDRGRVIERGRHDDLVARGGYYARAWERQCQRDALGG